MDKKENNWGSFGNHEKNNNPSDFREIQRQQRGNALQAEQQEMYQ